MTERKHDEFELEDLEKPLTAEDQKKTTGGVSTNPFKKPPVVQMSTSPSVGTRNAGGIPSNLQESATMRMPGTDASHSIEEAHIAKSAAAAATEISAEEKRRKLL